MKNLKPRLGVAALLLLLVVPLTGCNPISWTNGKSFGVDVSVTEPHIDTVIYRAPRKALFDAACPGGLCQSKPIADLIWNYGAPPDYSVCLLGVCYTNTDIRDHMYYFVYGNLPGGETWAEAIAQSEALTDCPVVRWIPTVIAYRGSTSGEGCRIGSLS